MEKQCPNCLLFFVPNSGKQKFCSDKCKVAFARKTAKQILGVTTADKVPQAKRKKFEQTVEDVADQISTEISWITLIEDYCGQEGVLPQDLIDAHRNRNKPKFDKKGTKDVNVEDFTQENSIGKPYDPFKNPLFKNKHGIK